MWALLLTWTAQASPTTVAPGRYGIHLKTATHAHIPVLGEMPGASVVWLLAEILPSMEGEPELVQRTCSVRMEGSGERASVMLSPGFLAALPEKHHNLVFSESGQVFIDMGEDHIGYDPTLYPDALPRDEAAPGLIDFDGDGNPGATVIITVPILGTVELYIAQHAQSSLVGQIHSDGTLTGTVESLLLEQQTLDATNPLMRMSPRMSLDTAHSHWRMQPLPADTTCDTIIERMCLTGGSGCAEG
ncbi:MAG: hypothetical protein P8R54_24380 [Myxococcota bacterium]|nr:hypothetical protein [Myxococcota bacterium]